MKKSVIHDEAFYSIDWSELIAYDKHSAARILPDLSGILFLYRMISKTDKQEVLCYGCWRDGLRQGTRNLFDPHFSLCPDIIMQTDNGKNLFYKYSIIDTSCQDMQDVLFWLVQNYEPEFNNTDRNAFTDSQRYVNISVKENDPRIEIHNSKEKARKLVI